MQTSLITIPARSTAPETLFGDMIPWLGILVLIVLLGGGLAIWIRRRITSQSASSQGGYMLEDLRQLRDSGELSQEEFDLARQAMIKGVRNASEISSEEAENSENPLRKRYQAGNGDNDAGTP